MDYLMLVNKTNSLFSGYVPDDLILVSSKYKGNIKLDRVTYENFLKMQEDAGKYGYEIDIMSGYRDYLYQENCNVLEKMIQDFVSPGIKVLLQLLELMPIYLPLHW